MTELFYETELLLEEGILSVLFSEDFTENSLSFDPHIHMHVKHELHYIAEGGCDLKWGNEALFCPQGHILIIPAGVEHKIYPREGTRAKSLLYVSKGHPSGKPSSLAALCPSRPITLPDGIGMGKRLLRVSALIAEDDPLLRDYVRGEMTLFFAELFSLLLPLGKEKTAARGENRAETIAAYISKGCYCADCSCESLAKQMHLSTRQLHRLCLAYYGLPFRALLVRSRMEIAKHRLETTDISVTELAEALGYASVASFSAAYKRHFGTAPTKSV